MSRGKWLPLSEYHLPLHSTPNQVSHTNTSQRTKHPGTNKQKIYRRKRFPTLTSLGFPLKWVFFCWSPETCEFNGANKTFPCNVRLVRNWNSIEFGVELWGRFRGTITATNKKVSARRKEFSKRKRCLREKRQSDSEFIKSVVMLRPSSVWLRSNQWMTS